MFGTILISIVTLMHIYVFWRAVSVPFIKSRIPKKIIIGAGLILWILFYLGRVYDKVLSQDRQSNGLFQGRQVVQVSFEKLLVREKRDG